MSYSNDKVQKYCNEISDSYGVDCDKHCAIADLCKRCGGDFESFYEKGVEYADKSVETLDKLHADNVANEVLVEYYKKQLEASNEEIATLKEMNKILAESIKNLSAKAG